MKDLIINDTLISMDDEGRFSLNDLHKASGGLVKDLPNKFMASASVGKVIDVLIAGNSAFTPVIKKRGRYDGGTWVCKELVYKYAMWVNAEFEVNVIQTFDKIINAKASPKSLEAFNALTARIESNKELASFCGKELAAYKNIKRKDEQEFKAAINDIQLTLGFSKSETKKRVI